MVANVVIKVKGSDTALFAAEQSVADFLILAELNLQIVGRYETSVPDRIGVV